MTSLSVALVGNPNGGKSTLFNALTGANQHVGNWPGVTVERKSGSVKHAGTILEIVDLPGLYSLTLASDSLALDERVACDYILERRADVYVNVVDASHLERHLYLTTQLLEMGVPVILALNMMDVARSRHLYIDVAALSQVLGCTVVTLEAHKGHGVSHLKRMLIAPNKQTAQPLTMPYPKIVQQAIQQVMQRLPENTDKHLAVRLLEEEATAYQQVAEDVVREVKLQQRLIQETLHEDADILLADARYSFIQSVLKQCVSTQHQQKTTWTTRIDALVLHRFLGIPVFLAVMYFLFLFSIDVGGAFQEWFDKSSQVVFVDSVAALLSHLSAPAWLIALLANGVGKGMNTIITFVPVIGALFLFLALLEDSGYMARAAFVVDRLMRVLGLPGKAFVPMIIGFGCNVPAVMAARTLDNKRDRILSIVMSPFMSCGARLAIYAVFTAAFFPKQGHYIVFALYLIGIVMAMLTGFMLRRTLLKGDPAPLVMELPAYHVPRLRSVFMHAWRRLQGFVFRAGKLIIPVCIIIGALNALHVDGSLNSGEGDTHSLLSIAGQWVTPVFAPMGIHADNWPATVGLMTGVLAKEVVVGTLNTLYAQLAAVSSHADVYGYMYQQFDGRIGAFAYLLFVLLYFPCVSTLAAMLRELHRGWALFSACWSTGVAYGVAVLFYQSATFLRHPLSSAEWVVSLILFFAVVFALIRWVASRLDGVPPTLNVLPAGESA